MAIPPPAKEQASKGGIFLLGVLCSALISVPVSLYVAKKSNTAMVIQEQTLAQVQTFETTGGELDKTVRQVSDALAKHKSTEEGREALRDAVADHSSAAFVLRDEIGQAYKPYMAKMAEMRNYADRAETPEEGVKMWQSAVDLIGMRKRISDRMTAEVVQ